MQPLRYRSKLFVHGSERDTYEPAFQTAADSVVLNNEDHVDEDMKETSRRWIVEFLDQKQKLGGKLIQVRANEVGSSFFDADIDAFVHPSVDVINITKIETPEQVQRADAAITRLEAGRKLAKPIGLLLTIESPVGLRRVHELAKCNRVVGLQIGYGDLLRPLDIDFRGPGADVVRLLVRMAAAEAGISAFDGAYLGDVDDTDGYRTDALKGAGFGFIGKSCNSSAQVDIANAVFPAIPGKG